MLTGSDRGKTQRVLRVFPDKGTVLVEHVRVVKKTVSSKEPGSVPRAASPSRSRRSTFRTWCWSVPLRRGTVGYKMQGDTRQRVCKKCGQELPTKK